MPNEEPSVLDYLKSKLKFWERGGKVDIPAEQAAEPPARRAEAVPAPEPPAEVVLPRLAFPWRSLLALVLALAAQAAFEPPARAYRVAIYLYVVSASLLVWGIFKKEWKLPQYLPDETRQELLTFRRWPLILSIPLALAAFAFLGKPFADNLFTVFNVTLWVLAIACLVWAFWYRAPRARPDKVSATENGPAMTGNTLTNDRLGNSPIRVTSARQGKRRIAIGVSFTTSQGGTLTLAADGDYRYAPPPRNNVPPEGVRETFVYTITDEEGEKVSSTLTIDVSDSDLIDRPVPVWKRWRALLAGGSWQLTLTRWTLLVVAVAGLVIFYRVYRISLVPAEPFSDHAEKLLDVYDVTQGQTHIFFPRNTGREAIQMYLTVVLSWLLGTGLSFLTLKIDTVLCGLLTLPYLYLLGKEFGGRRVGLLAVLFAGIAYWPNIISRVGLRFPLYPLFVAPTLYYLLRGLRTRRRNDFILSGLFLGFGLHGYSPFRIVPIVVVIAVGLYLLHRQSQGYRRQAVIWLVVLALISLFVFLPLARYWLDYPDIFGMRAFSRLGTPDNPIPGVWWQVLLSNTWNALKMFNWDNGNIWVHSVPDRPALDVVSGALFLIGSLLILVRYLRERHWQDLFLLLAVPLLLLPSILSLAFPDENPALNRAAGALVPTFLIVALALDGLFTNLESSWTRQGGVVLMWIAGLALVGVSASQNFDLVFNQYATQYRQGAWNTSEMGAVIKQFGQTYGSTDNSWIVPYPYWVDTRLPGVWAGIPNRDFALWPQDFAATQDVSGPKLIIIKPEDQADIASLEQLYPQGVLSTFHSATNMDGKDFLIFFIPPAK